jgi:hypothetical protein
MRKLASLLLFLFTGSVTRNGDCSPATCTRGCSATQDFFWSSELHEVLQQLEFLIEYLRNYLDSERLVGNSSAAHQ